MYYYYVGVSFGRPGGEGGQRGHHACRCVVVWKQCHKFSLPARSKEKKTAGNWTKRAHVVPTTVLLCANAAQMYVVPTCTTQYSVERVDKSRLRVVLQLSSCQRFSIPSFKLCKRSSRKSLFAANSPTKPRKERASAGAASSSKPLFPSSSSSSSHHSRRPRKKKKWG